MDIICPECLTKNQLDDPPNSSGANPAQCLKCKHFLQVKDSEDLEFLSLTQTTTDVPDKDKGNIFYEKVFRSHFLSWLSVIFTIILAGMGILVFSFTKGDFLAEKPREITKMISNMQEWGQSLVEKTPFIKNFLFGVQFFTPYISYPDEQPEGMISLEDLRGYYIENRLLETILIIEGQAVNHWMEPRSFIKVKGVLFNSKGNKVEEKSVYCGNILLENDLKDFSPADIEKSLSSQFGVSFSNVNIPPGGSVPFMIVFIDSLSNKDISNQSNNSEGELAGMFSQLSDFSVEVVNSQKGSE